MTVNADGWKKEGNGRSDLGNFVRVCAATMCYLSHVTLFVAVYIYI